MTADEIIRLLELEPLQNEGGMYRVTLRGAIYYFLCGRAFSHMHRLAKDEVYHHYLGDAVELLRLSPDGTGEIITLGGDLSAGHRPQVLVNAGCWQGSRLKEGGEYALMGTTMCPAFSPGDYQHGDAGVLKEQYPEFAHMIDVLTGDAIYK